MICALCHRDKPADQLDDRHRCIKSKACEQIALTALKNGTAATRAAMWLTRTGKNSSYDVVA